VRTIREQEILTLNERAKRIVCQCSSQSPGTRGEIGHCCKTVQGTGKGLDGSQAQERGDFRVEPLGKAHDRAAFWIGSESLDNYLHKQASQDVSKRAAVCFVLTPTAKLSPATTRFRSIPWTWSNCPKRPPRDFQSTPRFQLLSSAVGSKPEISRAEAGEFLLLDASYRCLQQSKEIASAAVDRRCEGRSSQTLLRTL